MQHVDEGQLHAYLDGELAELGGDPRELERHLGSCPECAERMEGVRRLRERGRAFLAAGPARPVAQPPFEEVVARARTIAPATRRPRYLAPVVWAASLAVALGAGWLARGLLRESAPEQIALVEQAETPAAAGAAQDLAAPPVEPQSGRGALAAPRAAARPQGATGAVASPESVERAGDAAPGPVAEVAMGAASAKEEEEPTVVALEGRSAREVAMSRPAPTPAAPPPAAAEPAPMASAAGAARARTARAPGSAAAFAPGEGGEWRATDVAGARRVLGRDPFTVPGLGTISVETGDVEGEPAVRVRQSLESGGEIVLVQTRGAAAAPRSAPAGWVTVARGNVTVAASAALDEAALRALLERLR